MSNSNPVVALANSFASRDQEIDERIDVLILRGVFADAAEQAIAIKLCDNIPTPFVSAQVYDPEIQGDIQLDEDFNPHREVVISIGKPEIDDVAAFIFAEYAAKYIKNTTPPRLLSCLELDLRTAFLCRGLKVETWNLSEALTTPNASTEITPRKLVKDFVPDREITENLAPWLLIEPPAVTSKVYEAWRQQAARYLLGGLVNAALRENGQVWLQANGPPLLRIPTSEPQIEKGLDELTKGTEWVYLNGNDRDVRHLIFAVELARASRSDTPFAEVIRQALESAITTYEAHVQSASRETLKALAELRKTVVDETQKITQRAHDLTSALWRDAAVSASPFVLKVLGDATKLPSAYISSGFYFAAAAFITISFLFQFGINRSYFNNQRKARGKWFDTLYSIISPNERKLIADDPIKNAETTYNTTQYFVGALYAALVCTLITFGVITLPKAKELSSIIPSTPSQIQFQPRSYRRTRKYRRVYTEPLPFGRAKCIAMKAPA